MDCCSPRKNMNTVRPGTTGPIPGAPMPDLHSASPAQPVLNRQIVEAASCKACNSPMSCTNVNMQPSCPMPVIPQVPGPGPVMPQVSSQNPVMSQVPNSGPVMPQMSCQGPAMFQNQMGSSQSMPGFSVQNTCTNTAPGHLERNYTVAMAYVPWQQWQRVYPMEQGFRQGTIFPDLDRPVYPRRCSS